MKSLPPSMFRGSRSSVCIMPCLLCLSIFLERQALSPAGQGGRLVALCSIKGPSASVGEIIIQRGRNRGGKDRR